MNITTNSREEAHRLYQELKVQCPEFFTSGHGVEYITDAKSICGYEDVTGERLGVLYKMGTYEAFVVDLIEKDGALKLHGRIIMPDNGVIIVPKLGNKFVLEDQYRYPVCGKHLAFPRGHCEHGSTPEQDAVREIEEECKGAELTNIKFLGKTYPETHSNVWYCSVFLGDIQGLSGSKDAIAQDGYEGIENLVLLTAEEIDDLIAKGKITCGYTLAAWALYRAFLES
jgi:8-oxo-dGTP pyrophosphatase MutT (NUDIX family)